MDGLRAIHRPGTTRRPARELPNPGRPDRPRRSANRVAAAPAEPTRPKRPAAAVENPHQLPAPRYVLALNPLLACPVVG